MTIGLNDTTRSARVNLIRDAIDAGGAAGFTRIYDGTRPTKGGTATNLLSQHTNTYPSAPNASSGVLTFSAIGSATAGASGTATWGRHVTSAGVFVEDFSVGTSGSGADLILNTTTITSGVSVAISSCVLTEGN